MLRNSYDDLCSANKTEIHYRCFLQNFRTAIFENYFGGDRSEKKTEEGMRIKLCGLRF